VCIAAKQAVPRKALSEVAILELVEATDLETLLLLSSNSLASI
jgi:hypothetical protein